ncbi:hypothetical protein SYNPS1DRAFT_27446 [Syncephalis pseudoplumigaleata]|uniref:Uncharacterized protein n=1 Tax=Syncephalis pseudoplumigaleata TaxID=1712513 RepID=A0A4P9Z5H1_9FUNG|nr:hypothetical protein SYNPS1DRAFT_27446 [Syncephalis pseudoplumigaleata]|eukprot:RKP26870.1 hypothetical protein SYNPS1DRAFT_27446 [Syncephalis pseudoplumigaleata]
MLRATTRLWPRSMAGRMTRPCAPPCTQPCRYESTAAAAAPAPARPDYKRGQYGYAPEFDPPKGSLRVPPPPTPARTLGDLPGPSKRRVPAGPASRRRAAMTKLRHDYAREVLSAEIHRRDARPPHKPRTKGGRRSATAATDATTDAMADSQAEADPLAPEQLLRVPPGIFSPTTGMPLRQPKRIDIDVSAKRRERRLKRMARQSRARSDALVELFHRSADFVTEANLEAKIDAFFSNPVYQRPRTLADLLGAYRDMSNSVSDIEGQQRLDELKRVLDGTSVDGKVGLETIKRWQAREETSSA